MLTYLLQLSLSLTNFTETFLEKDVIGKNTSKPYFVMFGSENCPACVFSKPEFLKAANISEGYINFGYANTKECKNIVFHLGFNSLPSFYLFFNSKTYRYPLFTRTSKKFISFISEKICHDVDEIQRDWIEEKGNKILLFEKKLKPTFPFAVAYSTLYKDNIKFGITNDESIIEEYGKQSSQSVILMFKGNNSSVLEMKEMNISSLLKKIYQFYEAEEEL